MTRRVTVVGAGFAALSSIRRLRQLDPGLDLTLVAPRPELVFYPGTIWIPSGLRRPEELVLPLEGFLRRHRVAFHPHAATGLSPDGRVLRTEGGEVENDGLVIGSGGRFIKALPGIEHAITPCEGIAAAVAIRDRLGAMDGGTIAIGFSGNPKEPAAMRGGPMFEYLFGLDRLLRKQGRRDRFRLVFFSPAEKPGQRLGPKAVDRLLREMARRGVETHLGHKLKGFSAGSVQTEGGEIPADLILFMPGMTGNQWFDATDLPRSEGGFIRADRRARVDGPERVYVAGDAGSYPGPDWMPKQAHMADLQAATAAENLVAELAGRTPEATFRVELVCIVDSLDSGMLVARTERFNLMLPASPVFHWAKRAFERAYLRRYR
ncbi:MAG: FAD-dependent oxidoreductase [Chromatiaceae bacterium]|nr:FAD-dependent oxidoreductase [Chromatiaceae bacterium]